MEDQVSTSVRLSYNNLRVETIDCLNEYISRKRGNLTRLKEHFCRILPDEDLRIIEDVSNLVDALERSGVIGVDNVEILKKLAEKLGLQELKEKAEEFEAECSVSGIFKRACNAIRLKADLSTKGVVVCLAGAALVYLYRENPKEMENLLPFVDFGIKVLTLLEGSVVFVLEVSSVASLKQLWQSYKDGSLKEKLKKSFNKMEELRKLSQGEEIDVEVTIDEKEYREVLLDLILLDVKGKSGKDTKSQRRHSVCCERDIPEVKPIDVKGNYTLVEDTKSQRRHLVSYKRHVTEKRSQASNVKGYAVKELVDYVSEHHMSPTEVAVKVAERLQLDKSSRVDPPAYIQKKCRGFCQYLKKMGRHDIIKELRKKIPSGMTGPLVHDDTLYREMDFNTRTKLTRALCGNDVWKFLASVLKVPGAHLGFFERQRDPAEAMLEEVKNGTLKVVELYDALIKCDAGALADEYL